MWTPVVEGASFQNHPYEGLNRWMHVISCPVAGSYTTQWWSVHSRPSVAPRATVVVGVGTVVVADVVGASLRGGGGADSGIGTRATSGAVPNVDLGAGYTSLWSWAFGLAVTE